MKNTAQYLGIFLIVFLIAGCKKIEKENKYFEMYELHLETQTPHQVNIIFQVLDKDEKGYPGLTSERFRVSENGESVGLEGSQIVAPFGTIPTQVKTVLLLDISGSVSSVFSQLKEAAIEFVNKKGANQQIAIYTFDSQVQLRQNFTDNASLLISAINSITVGSSSTNLYGAIKKAGEQETDIFSLNLIRVTNAVVFTDGKETTGSVSFEEALAASQNETIYTIGLNGPDLDENRLQTFGGNGKRYFKANNIEDLGQVFSDIQSDIDKLSKSVYWLYYQSPKRGNNTHSIKLEIIDNENTLSNGYITDYFSSATFTD